MELKFKSQGRDLEKLYGQEQSRNEVVILREKGENRPSQRHYPCMTLSQQEVVVVNFHR